MSYKGVVSSREHTGEHPWSPPPGSTLRLRRSLTPALAAVGAGLVFAATFVPVNSGGRSGYPVKIYDSAATTTEVQLFAIEPVGVAVLALLVALLALVSSRSRAWTAGMLLAFGLQSGLLFLAYFGSAAFGNPEYNSFAAGSALGLVGAVLLAVSGAVTLGVPARASAARR